MVNTDFVLFGHSIRSVQIYLFPKKRFLNANYCLFPVKSYNHSNDFKPIFTTECDGFSLWNSDFNIERSLLIVPTIQWNKRFQLIYYDQFTRC